MIVKIDGSFVVLFLAIQEVMVFLILMEPFLLILLLAHLLIFTLLIVTYVSSLYDFSDYPDVKLDSHTDHKHT